MKLFPGIFTLAFVILFGSCKKDKDVITVPETKPVLSVKLGQAYLGSTQTDSAFAEWTTGALKQRVQLTISHDSLLADMASFTDGNGELTIHIFSNIKYSNQYKGQFVLHKTVSLQNTKALAYNGPASFTDANWLPRVKLADGIGHAAVIALRPDDPYFMVSDPGHPVVKLTVERSFWKTQGGIQLVGQGVWECTANCLGHADKEFFSNLPAKIGGRAWNHISIIVLFETNANGGGWVISLEHEP